MIDNKILSDAKNLSIYNGIYSNKRKLNDYLNSIKEEQDRPKIKKTAKFDFHSENKIENISICRNNKNTKLSVINKKENNVNNQGK